jgi:hypothetical protein
MTTTATFAAGVAVITGFEGMPANTLSALKFWYGTDGHCGAGAPRFNVNVNVGGTPMTFFFGCTSGMVQGTDQGGVMTAPNGRIFDERMVPPSSLATLPGTITSIAIVFDEGTDAGQGFVFLDNINVSGHIWTSPADNGNHWDPSTDTQTIEELTGLPLTALFP